MVIVAFLRKVPPVIWPLTGGASLINDVYVHNNIIGIARAIVLCIIRVLQCMIMRCTIIYQCTQHILHVFNDIFSN